MECCVKDWTGNSNSARTLLGSTGNADNVREDNDFYATHPLATELLLELEELSHDVWEPCCGQGHIGKVLEDKGFNVKATDLVYRGYGRGGEDFLQCTTPFNGDIVTNPPYMYAPECVIKALELIPEGYKVCMFLKLQFLEGLSHYELFKAYPPRTIYVAVRRMQCSKGGKFLDASMVCYCWFVWVKGYAGSPEIRWFNYEPRETAYPELLHIANPEDTPGTYPKFF